MFQMRALYQVQTLSARENDNGQYYMGKTEKLIDEASLVDRMLTHSMRNWIVYERKGTSFHIRNSIGGKSGSLTVITGSHYSGFLTLI